MSIDRNSTQVFINLFRSGLISNPDFDEFYQKTRDLQEDNEIADAIEGWLQVESRSQILKAYKKRMKEIIASYPIDSNQTLGGWKSESSTKSYQPSPTSRELLDNAMPRPYPTTNPSSQPQTNKQ